MSSSSTSYFLCSPFKIYDPLSKTQSSTKPNPNRKPRTAAVRAARHEADDHDFYSGRLVDEGLLVLRKRIHEIKTSERSREAPREWMDWERELYRTDYDSVICDAMGRLQSYLMETRPSLVLGAIVVIALSVTFSTAVVVYSLFEWIKFVIMYICRGIHLLLV